MTQSHSVLRSSVRYGSIAVLLLSLGVALMRLQLMQASAHQGIDFTDEGYYLVWISNPWAYAESITLFGFVYHPLFVWLGEDVAKLRQANILITATLAWIFVVVFFRAAIAEHWPAEVWRSWPMLGLGVVLATAYPNVIGMWLPTPSYNSLALQALLIAATGLLLMERQLTLLSMAGALILGVGGWLAFLAKPSTGGAIAVVALLYLWSAGKLRVVAVLLAATISAGLLGATAWQIDGSITAFVERLSGAIELSRLMGVEQPLSRLFRIDGFALHASEALLFLALAAFVVFAVGVNPPLDRERNGRVGRLWMVGAMGFSAMLMVMGVASLDLDKGAFQGLLMFAPALGAVVAALFMWRTRWEGEFSRPCLSMAGLLVVLPHVFAFGTGNNYWQLAQGAGLFWLMGGIAILLAAAPEFMSWRAVLPVAVVAQWVSVVLLQGALAHPYRQPGPLYLADTPVEVGSARTPLRLMPTYARYISEITQKARASGLRPGTPVIDMTGHSPGTLYALGARSTGQAWLIGGYPGSNRTAKHVLTRVSCAELALAWVLTEEAGPRYLGVEVLQKTGLDLVRDFDVVGHVRSPDGFGDYKTGSEQKLLRPSRTPAQAQAACENTRSATK